MQAPNRAFVLMQYFGYLRRNPNDLPDADYTGYDFWLQKLDQFHGDFAEHTLVIYRRGGELLADIDADGFQTSRRLRCTAKTDVNKISLYFSSYREDNVFEPYKKGQFLLALEKSTAGGRARLLTYWGAYQPAFGQARSGRVYFRKTK